MSWAYSRSRREAVSYGSFGIKLLLGAELSRQLWFARRTLNHDTLKVDAGGIDFLAKRLE